MPSTEQLRSRLVKKLYELFQIDQPDLDFGFYRIMHAKSKEVKEFISNDLLTIVADAFGNMDQTRKCELKNKIEREIEAAREYGITDPQNSPRVKEAQAAYDAVRDTASAEADVYDHLYRFFERYYDNGDFISRRYYTRETSGKAAPFALPYNGEEVKLHWANGDQYYIKSTEYFSNFTFDLTQSTEIRKMSKEERELNQIPASPLKAHFRVVEATEGEHGDVKASEANKRFFILHTENPVALTETGELVVNFEYRPDPEKTGQENTWRDKRNAEAVETILERLQAMAATGGEHEKQLAEYLRLFKVPAPIDSDKKRPVLAKYVNQYTARNTMDYFIHKDLGGFLRRELDFYIKNEVMRLDDIENAEVPAVESYLAKLKVLRKIAGKLIDFLAQLEDFQKKLWLKKKFVVETQYCLTLDRIFSNEQSTIDNDQLLMTTEQKWLLQQVVENKAQWAEWQKLGFVQLTINNEQLTEAAVLGAEDFTITFNGEKQEDGLFSQEPLTYRKLLDNCSLIIAHWNLVLDTRFFDDSFKARLVASIENFDEQCDGLLIHSDNFQALNLLQERYREQVKCVYIDPPYNTGGDGFAYKDSYQHSSWLSLIEKTFYIASGLMSNSCGTFTNIDDDEGHYLKILCDHVFGRENFIRNIVWQKRTSPDMRAVIGDGHDHIFVYAKDAKSFSSAANRIPKSEEQRANFRNPDNDPRGPWVSSDFTAQGYRPNQMYTITTPGGVDYTPPEGRCWKNVEDVFLRLLSEGRMWFGQDGKSVPRRKTYLAESEDNAAWSWWTNSEVGHNQEAKKESISFFGVAGSFMTPKPKRLLERIVHISTSKTDIVLDYFAGSGTTGHAVINLNREDDGKRKYILVEMGDYFDTILKPRIAKVVYSESWKDGRPIINEQSTMNKKKDDSLVTDHCSLFNGVSHSFKYIRLESYEDTLNNLRLDHNPQRKKAVAANPALKEDYMLHYFLDVETRGSQSVLNIDVFADPTAYTMNIKQSSMNNNSGPDHCSLSIDHCKVDLIETFNYLIGLRVQHTSVPQTFQATFKRITDPELPEDQHTKLVVDGRIRRVNEQMKGSDNCSLSTDHCIWWFRKVEGWVPRDPANPNPAEAGREKVLVVWRKLTDDIEQDNLMLDEWFQKNRISTRDFEFDTIYVNGSNNLPNLKQDDENWKVRLIEEEFMKRMWEAQ
jgi:adenine-specific DNA-methyltransferase